LREEPRPRSAVALRGVREQGMAQMDGSGRPGREGLAPCGRVRHRVGALATVPREPARKKAAGGPHSARRRVGRR
jgi:hypothetical protein